jgi:hypothetical protein
VVPSLNCFPDQSALSFLNNPVKSPIEKIWFSACVRYEDIPTNPDLTGSQRNSARIETNYSFFLLVEDYEDCLEEAPKMPGFL